MNSLAEDLERFRRGAEVLATVLTGAAGEEIDFAPVPGKWNIRQIMAHVADSELVGAHRLRLVIAEDNPVLTGFDQDAWTRNLDYARRKPTQSLETFRRLRAENYDLQTRYLQQVLGFIGFTDVKAIVVEPTLASPEAKEKAMANAKRQAAQLAAAF